MSVTLRVFTRTALVLALALSGIDLGAYALLGYKWGTSQVPYYVNPRNNHVPDANTVTAIRNAASAWTAQSSANIQFVYAGTTNGSSFTVNTKNEVFFRSDSTSPAGETYWWTDAGGRLIDADTAFNQGRYAFSADGLPCAGALDIQNLATHELGHALGLLHSGASDATMYPTMSAWCDTSWRSLSSDDIAAVQAAYPGGPTPTAPSAPASLMASRNPANATAGLLLSWTDKSSNESGFTIERSGDGVSFGQIAQLGVNSVSFTDTGLTAGVLYYYRVLAFNAAGSSPYSNVSSARTDSVSAPTPTLNARAYLLKRSRKVDLTWSGFGAASVDVYRNGVRVVTTTNDGSHTDSLKQAGAYIYKLCGAGTTICSNQVSVTF
jgi:hypothetical protein